MIWLLLALFLFIRFCPSSPSVTIRTTFVLNSLVIREYTGRKVRLRRITISSQPPGSSSLLKLVFLLLLDGGIHPNLGPVRYPCSICCKAVRSNQEAINCDGCHMWSHCKCNSVDSGTYQILMNSGVFDWHCLKCLLSELPFRMSELPLVDGAFGDGLEDMNPEGGTGDYQHDDGVHDDQTMGVKLDDSTRFVKLALINVRSLLSCVEEVWHSITRNNVDLLGLNETWLDGSVADDEVCLSGFSVVRNDRSRTGGGVALLIANRIPYHPRWDLCLGLVESVWVELFPKSGNRSVFVCCVYRPPTTSPTDFFENLLLECEHDCVLRSRIILMGDFNCDCLSPSLYQSKQLQKFCERVDLKNITMKPTRCIKEKTSILGLILTNQSCSMLNTMVLPFTGSDHHMVSTHYYPRGIKVPGPHKYAYLRSYKRLRDPEIIRQCLSCLSIWNDVTQISDIDELECCFSDIAKGLLDILCPMKRVRVRQYRPEWLDNEAVKNARRLKRKAHSRALKLQDDDSWREYRRCRNYANKRIKVHKARSLEDQARNDVKSFWKQLSYLNGKSSGASSSRSCIHDVNDMNKYFLSMQKEIVKNLVLPSNTPCPTSYLQDIRDVPDFSFETVETQYIESLLRDLDSSKATGDDGLPATFVKALHTFFSTPITYIVNKSLADGVVPRRWKRAIVTPIPKKSGATALTNFRPVSVLSILSKILERVVQVQVTNHILSHGLLSPYQSGFRPGYSTQDVLVRVVDSWLACLDNRKCVGAIFLDLAKAFDCVDHDVLLKKLPFYGFRNASFKWFTSYLSDRSQRVRCSGSTSDWGVIQSGVPQGSILGPLLFSIYINDLPTILQHLDINIYADDSELHCSGRSIDEIEKYANSDLRKIEMWLAANHLKVNVSKSACMLIGSKRKYGDKTFKVSLCGEQIPNVDNIKYLGVYIDRFLKWDAHISHLIGKMKSRVYMLCRLKPLSSTLLLRLYKVYILPVVDYCSISFNSCSKTLSDRLDRMHYRAMRYLALGESVGYPPPPSERRKYFSAIQTYKILHGLSPSYLLSSVQYAESLSHRSLRNKYRARVPPIKSNYGRQSFYFSATSIWNSLSLDLCSCRTLKSFKLLYKIVFEL